ncbi:MAG: PKD domain-containing protein [Candidatus Thermoplasmatota archaeon]
MKQEEEATILVVAEEVKPETKIEEKIQPPPLPKKKLQLRGKKFFALCIVLIILATSYCILIYNQPPIPELIIDKGSAMVGEIVSFDGSLSKDLDGKIIEYSWDFGDGTRASGKTAKHFYTSPSRYHPKLVVKDDRGAIASSTKSITITALIVKVPSKKIGDRGDYAVNGFVELWNNETGLVRYSLLIKDVIVYGVLMSYLGQRTEEVRGVVEKEDGMNLSHRTIHIHTSQNINITGNVTADIGKFPIKGYSSIDESAYRDITTGHTIQTISNASTNLAFTIPGVNIEPIVSIDNIRSYPRLVVADEQFHIEEIVFGHIFDTKNESALQGSLVKGEIVYFWSAKKPDNINDRECLRIHITVDEKTMKKRALENFYMDLWYGNHASLPLKILIYCDGNANGNRFISQYVATMTNFKAGKELISGVCISEHYNLSRNTVEFNITPVLDENTSFAFSPELALSIGIENLSTLREYLSTEKFAISGNYTVDKEKHTWLQLISEKNSKKGYLLNVTFENSVYKYMGGIIDIEPINITKPEKIITICSAEKIFANDTEINTRLFTDGKINFTKGKFSYKASLYYPNVDISSMYSQVDTVGYAYTIGSDEYSAGIDAEYGQLIYVWEHSGVSFADVFAKK